MAVPKGTPLFIAAQNHTGGSEYLVVSNDIKKPEDLIGKKISLGSDPETENLNWAEWSINWEYRETAPITKTSI